MQKKAFADEPARIVAKVYEKPRGSCGLEGSDRSSHINGELFKIILKRPHKQLVAVNNEAAKTAGQLTMPVMLSGRRYETMSLALLLTGDNSG